MFDSINFCTMSSSNAVMMMLARVGAREEPIETPSVHILAKQIAAFLRPLKNTALVTVQKLIPTLTLASTSSISKL